MALSVKPGMIGFRNKKIRKNKDKTNYTMTKQILHEVSTLKNQEWGKGAQQHVKEG